MKESKWLKNERLLLRSYSRRAQVRTYTKVLFSSKAAKSCESMTTQSPEKGSFSPAS